MRRALAVAETVRGTTSPNPFVGALVVADGELVASGATGPPGSAHAEVRALAAAAHRSRGATLVVTLEPCAHTGRTPPCTDAILAAGIARVVVGLSDPNPVAAGGAARLAEAGVEVVTGVLADRVAAQQEAFLVTVEHGRPHVTLKVAQRRDGTTRSTDGRWITGPDARRRVHALRADVDAVLVGSGTALADDPALTVRDAAPGPRPPRAVVLDRRGRLPVDLRLVRPGTIVVTSTASDPGWRDALVDRNVEVLVPHVDADDLPGRLAALLDHDVAAVLAEPGTTLGAALLADDVVDRLLLHVADTDVADDRRWTPALPVDHLVPVARRRLGTDVEWEFGRPAAPGLDHDPDREDARSRSTSTPVPAVASDVREPSDVVTATPVGPSTAAPARP